MAVSLGTPAFAASPSQQGCEAQSGTFIRQRGWVQCIIAEGGEKPRFTEATATSGEGNIDNERGAGERLRRIGRTSAHPASSGRREWASGESALRSPSWADDWRVPLARPSHVGDVALVNW